MSDSHKVTLRQANGTLNLSKKKIPLSNQHLLSFIYILLYTIITYIVIILIRKRFFCEMGRIQRKGTLDKSKIKVKSIQKTRKQLRKEKRQQKRINKAEYYQKKKLKNQLGKSLEISRTDDKSLKLKEKDDEMLSMKTQRQKPKDMKKEKMQKNAKKQRMVQLQRANLEENKTIKHLEKQLKLNKRKSKSIPKSFISDGLDCILDN